MLSKLSPTKPDAQSRGVVSRANRTIRRLRRFQRKPLGIILSETTSPPDRLTDVRISAVAVGFGAGSLFVPALGLITVPLLLYSARGVIRFGIKSFVKGHPNTATLVAIVLLASLLTQYYLFATLSALVAQYSYIVSDKVKKSARVSMIDIFSLRPKTVWIPYDEDTEIEVPLETVQAGEIIIVHTGEVIPIDGTVIKGLASVDQHILTGEAQPIDKVPGDTVFASTILVSGRLYLRVDKTGDETTVAQIGSVLNQTLDFKANRQLKADAWADKTVIPTMLFSAAVLPVLGPAGSLTVINAHFKRRMSLFAPIIILNYFRILSDQSILVKDGRTLDAIADVDTVVFDKTGTLTIAQPTLGNIYTYTDADANTVLRLAASAEAKQTHPIALAILEAAAERGLQPGQADDMAYQVGYGLTVDVEGAKVRIGSLRFMEAEQLNIPVAVHQHQETSHAVGHSLVIVARDEQIIGAIELVPTVRSEAADVVQWLRQWGVRNIYIISGDHTTPTARLAAELDIDGYFAEVLPHEKADIIAQLQAEGRTVCYVGDGINDSIALKKAAVSVSLSGATTIAVDTAQVVLMQGTLTGLPALFQYGREYDQNLQNLFRYTSIAPMMVSLAFLPIPVVNLWVSLSASVYGLTSGTIYAMWPMWRYRTAQRSSLLPSASQPITISEHTTQP